MRLQDDTHSKLIGYLLWVFGFIGAHRFYYGRQLTGTLYFFTLGLLLIGILCHLMPETATARNAGWAILLGTVLFSGSLYLMVLTGLKPLGMITPFGGIAFLLGWLLLGIAAWQYPG